jgi:predicted nucleotidyltransferase
MKKKYLAKKYQQKTKDLVRILKKIRPEKIILFGSVAQGKIHPDSDIDICVIKRTKDRLKIKEKIWDLLWKADYNWEPEVEIHVYSPEIYQDWLSRNDPFLEEIEKGKILYGR